MNQILKEHPGHLSSGLVLTERGGNIEKFIPGTNVQFAWSAHSLTIAMECPRKYYLSVIEGWKARDTSMHLIFGGVVSSALELYNQLRWGQGVSHEDAMLEAVGRALQHTTSYNEDGEPVFWETGNSQKNRETVIRAIVWYLDKYKDDPAKVLILDGVPAVEVPFSFEIDQKVYGGGETRQVVLNGYFDKLVHFMESNFVMDQKTTGSTLGPYYFDRYKLDNQVSLYTFASQIITERPFAGVMIDAMQTAVGFTAFDRGLIMRSTEQLNEWMETAQSYIRLMNEYASEDHWPMNLTSCNNFGKCQFIDVCSKAQAVRGNYLKTQFQQVETGAKL